jgi:hypothetical protein
MAERPEEAPSEGEPGTNRAATPRWVKAFAIAALILVAAFVIFHLAGGGLGGHMPSHVSR